MKKTNLFYLGLTTIFLVLAILACDLPGETGQAATETMQALGTTVALTMEAGGSAQDPDSPAATAEDSPEDAVPSDTLEPTATATLGPPMLSVSLDTNCRFGPGDAYDYLGALLVGEEALVTGKLADESFWYIENPDAPPPQCWVWGMYASISGDKSGIPILTPPPTPTPSPEPFAFQTEFGGAIPCGAYAFFARIENTGSVAIESLRLEVIDTDINLTNTHVNNIFATSVACTPSTTPHLQPGEVGYTFVSGFQTIQNHHFKATVKVCSQDGLTGECATATFSVP